MHILTVVMNIIMLGLEHGQTGNNLCGLCNYQLKRILQTSKFTCLILGHTTHD
jgi:hypothetical protein